MADAKLALREQGVGVHAALAFLFRLETDRLFQSFDRAREILLLVQHVGDVKEVGGLVVAADRVPVVIRLRQRLLRLLQAGVCLLLQAHHGRGVGLLAA